jgi:hypothetical protein
LKDTNKQLVADVAEREVINQRRKEENDFLKAAVTRYKLQLEDLKKELQSKGSSSGGEESVDTSSQSEQRARPCRLLYCDE